ncbi:MAG TPA: O-antigen ligase family protein [Steroidobacteraceae bacterium]|nr:O-antigen ligase family protein [Steroidobacteraceae bacterium]
MSKYDELEDPRTRLTSLLLPLAAAVLAGGLAAVAGAAAGTRAIYLLAVPGCLAIAGALVLTRPQPLRFAFLAILALLPFADIAVPPGRWNLTVFDVASLVLAAGLLLHKAFARDAAEPLFPARSLAVILLLLVPCTVFARHPWPALLNLLLIFAAYVFFWFVLQELRRPEGLERVAGLLAVTGILAAIGLFIDHYLHINLSLRGSNLNQFTQADNGEFIWRAGGIFQDGQKAGDFLAALLTFLLVLLMRGRCRSGWLRLLVWSALLLGIPALFLTVSRAALFSFVPVCLVALLAANRWPLPLKLCGFAAMAVLAATVMVAPGFWMGLLPGTLAARMVQSQAEFSNRVDVWFDTWEMFARHPLTGVGLHGFQQYLLDTRPLVFNYYGIGEDSGVVYVPDQPESAYFKILYESGILGSVAVVVLVVATLHRSIVALVSKATVPDVRSEVAAALAGLAVFAATFVTLFSIQDPRLLVLLLILLAIAWRPSIAPSSTAARP